MGRPAKQKGSEVDYKSLKPRDIFRDPENGKLADFWASRERLRAAYNRLDADNKPIPARDTIGNIRINPATGQPVLLKAFVTFELRQAYDKNHTAISRYALENADMYEFDEDEIVLENGKPKKIEQNWEIYRTLKGLADGKMYDRVFQGEERLISSFGTSPDGAKRERVLTRKLEEGQAERQKLQSQLEEANALLAKIKDKNAEKKNPAPAPADGGNK